MSRLFACVHRALARATRPVLALLAVAVLAAGSVAPTSAATTLSTSGRIGSVSLLDTSASPGVTCEYVRKLSVFGGSTFFQSPALSKITLRGPRVGTIINSVADGAIVPTLVSVDYRVFQNLIVNGEPAGSRLVLSSVHQALATTLTPVAIPSHTFDASGLPSGSRYTAQIVVTWKSLDQRTTVGSKVIRYDFYQHTIHELFFSRNVGVSSFC